MGKSRKSLLKMDWLHIFGTKTALPKSSEMQGSWLLSWLMKNSDLLEILKVTLLSSCRFQTQKKNHRNSNDTNHSGTPPYDHPVYKTTSLLRPYSFKPKVQNIDSFYYFEDPVNATTSLLRPGFYGPTVVVLTGFHCKTLSSSFWQLFICPFTDWIIE